MRFAMGSWLVVMSTTSLTLAEPSSTPCSGPKLVLEPPLSHRRQWSKAAGEARRRVAELQDVDACTRIEVEQTSDSVRVRAEAADGRSVVRELSEPDELEATVVALLVLPPAGTGPTEATPSSTTPEAAKPASAPAKPAAARPPAPSVNPAADRGTAAATGALPGASPQRSFEMALGGSARASSYLVGPGITARLDWQLSGWLFGGLMHAEQMQASTAAGRYQRERSAAAGFTFGRRLVRGPFYVDVLLEAPIFALRSSTYTIPVQQSSTPPSDDGTQTEPGETGEPSDDGPTSTTQTADQTKAVPIYGDLRAGAALRTVVPFKGSFAMFAELDAEHTLGILKAPSANGQPSAIGWCAGLSLGLFWGTH